MRTSITFLVSLSALLAGCSPADPVAEGSSLELSASEPMGSRITISGGLVKYEDQSPFRGVSVCLNGHSEPCVKTNADGRFTLTANVRPGEDLLVVSSVAGYTKTAFPLTYEGTSATMELGTFLLITTELFHQYDHVVSGQPYDVTKGVALVNVVGGLNGPYLGGAQISFTPNYHVFYNDSHGMPDSSLTSTTVGGRGLGGIAHVTTGEVAAKVTVSGKTCSPFLGWKPGASGTMRIPILADTIVSTMAICH